MATFIFTLMICFLAFFSISSDCTGQNCHPSCCPADSSYCSSNSGFCERKPTPEFCCEFLTAEVLIESEKKELIGQCMAVLPKDFMKFCSSRAEPSTTDAATKPTSPTPGNNSNDSHPWPIVIFIAVVVSVLLPLMCGFVVASVHFYKKQDKKLQEIVALREDVATLAESVRKLHFTKKHCLYAHIEEEGREEDRVGFQGVNDIAAMQQLQHDRATEGSPMLSARIELEGIHEHAGPSGHYATYVATDV